jgi:hypothetical protein
MSEYEIRPESRQVARLQRRLTVVTAISVAALLVGPAAGYITARAFEKPGPRGPQGQTGMAGPGGPTGLDGPQGPPGTVDPAELQREVAQSVANQINLALPGAVAQQCSGIQVVTSVTINTYALGGPQLQSTTGYACAAP